MVGTRDHEQGQGTYQPLAADFNGDGKADLALRKTADGLIYIRLGDGKGQFTQDWAPYAWTKDDEQGEGPYQSIAGDFDGDGYCDLALRNTHDGLIYFRLADGHGRFEQKWTEPCRWTRDHQSNEGTYHPFAGDFNGDGKCDIGLRKVSTGVLYFRVSDGSSSRFSTEINTQRLWPADSQSRALTPIAGRFTGGKAYDIGVRSSQGALEFRLVEQPGSYVVFRLPFSDVRKGLPPDGEVIHLPLEKDVWKLQEGPFERDKCIDLCWGQSIRARAEHRTPENHAVLGEGIKADDGSLLLLFGWRAKLGHNAYIDGYSRMQVSFSLEHGKVNLVPEDDPFVDWYKYSFGDHLAEAFAGISGRIKQEMKKLVTEKLVPDIQKQLESNKELGGTGLQRVSALVEPDTLLLILHSEG